MTNAATIAALLLGICSMIGTQTALNRADASDRRAAELENRINLLEGHLTLEQKIRMIETGN
jgi:hypothetical protein